MPTTRKKVNKAIYKEDEGSEDMGGDFSDSGTEAEISPAPSSDEDINEETYASSGDEFNKKAKKSLKTFRKKKPQFAQAFISKIKKQSSIEDEDEDIPASNFSVKDLTEADKLLPSVLNLSESDSSDDDCIKPAIPRYQNKQVLQKCAGSDVDDNDGSTEYTDVWSNNEKAASEEIAKKTFLELEKHKAIVEEAKLSILNYSSHNNDEHVSNVKDLLAQGEETEPMSKAIKKKKKKKVLDQSDSDLEDWEEVKETKSIPQQGLQLIVDIPDSVSRKTKKVDVEMMMKRKMNRVKKECQVHMHKVHVLCWLGHGNYMSTVLNDQEVMSVALSLMPSKECYPGKRIDMKYVQQITTWYKDKLTLKQDKHEDKFRPKAPKLKEILLQQIKNKTITSRKYMVYIFVALLRAIGLQCRVMLNFVTVPIKPPAFELHSLSTKSQENKSDNGTKSKKATNTSSKKAPTNNIRQLDGSHDYSSGSDYDFNNIMQVDGNDDMLPFKTRTTRASKKNNIKEATEVKEEGVSPPKRAKKSLKVKPEKSDEATAEKKLSLLTQKNIQSSSFLPIDDKNVKTNKTVTPINTRSRRNCRNTKHTDVPNHLGLTCNDVPKIIVPAEESKNKISSEFFTAEKDSTNKNKLRLSRKRSSTTISPISIEAKKKASPEKVTQTKLRAKSTPARTTNRSKYFNENAGKETKNPKNITKNIKKHEDLEDKLRVSHKELLKQTSKPKNDVTADLVHIIKNRVKEAKAESSKKVVKGQTKKDSEEDDSDYLPVEDTKPRKSESDDDFKPVKKSPKPSTSRSTQRSDRRVFVINTSQDEEISSNRIDIWCEVYVEELEEWVAVDVIRSKVHLVNEIYAKATHPVAYVVGWDNNNYLKDLTRRYAPQWNTFTRKQRADVAWWNTAVQPWLGPKTARDKEEDERLDRMQLEAPLPKSISEYKNHPLYALKRHLLKYEALYPPDASTLGFVRGEPVYARECVYVCRSRDTWLKEAKVVKLGEQPYKVVKARPKWDKLSNKLITDKPLEIFGPWQVKDYEPPVAENGIVPRNAYGNVELFKDCMLPKGTVHIKLPGLNRIAKKLNIDCAPAMTGFDFNGGWSHPVFEGFVVCEEYKEIITEAWVEDQEELERKEREKIDARVYGNWRRLIKGLFIRERLKVKYGFDDPSTSQDKKKAKGPRLVVKKSK